MGKFISNTVILFLAAFVLNGCNQQGSNKTPDPQIQTKPAESAPDPAQVFKAFFEAGLQNNFEAVLDSMTERLQLSLGPDRASQLAALKKTRSENSPSNIQLEILEVQNGPFYGKATLIYRTLVDGEVIQDHVNVPMSKVGETWKVDRTSSKQPVS